MNASAEMQPFESAYARFLPRLSALVIDGIIMVVVIFGALGIAVAARSESIARPLGFTVVAFWLLYEPLLVSFAGGTIGHRRINLRVVDNRTGGNISFLKAVARVVIKGPLGVVSFITMLTTRRSQAIHDLLTRSTVQVRDLARAAPSLYIRERRDDPGFVMPTRTRRALVIFIYVLGAFLMSVAALLGLMSSGIISARCADYGQCTTGENIISTSVGGAWLAVGLLGVVLGWRGRLYGCRRSRS
jgi:uncharacterized RDD family membrane protein YckC